MNTGHLYFLRAGIVAAAAVLAACSSVGGSRGDGGDVVEARALERWNLLIAHQAEKAYDYLSPGFRQTITREKYAEQKNDVAVRWKAAHVDGHHCDGDSCTVRVMIDTQVQMPGVGKPAPVTLPAEERWVKVKSGWYYVPDTRMKATPVSPDGNAPDRTPAEEAKPAPGDSPTGPATGGKEAI